ncbi:ATP-binding cassette domain-containing protein [Streptomyces sp. NPDC058045]|uniref:ATP-binding cassette domain-containing protein n=1 Tax=Streptomyces sp. NPDC058045 TaxID=3346311 RepID=UPI0036E99AD6
MTSGAFLAARPKVRPDLQIGPRLVRGTSPVHLLKDPRTGRRMEVGPKEFFLITRLDGSRTLAEIGGEYAGEFGTRLGERQWGQLLRVLHGRSLLDGSPAPEPATAPPAAPTRPNGILSGRTRLVADAPALMDRLHRITAPARRPAVLTLLVALAVAVLAAVTAQAGTLWRQTAHTAHHQPVLLFAVGCLLWFSLAVHELAHGVFARAWGGRVNEIGLRWIAGATYLYCEIEDVQFLGNRRRKVATACAGTFANLLFLVPFYPLWALLPADAQARPFFGTLLLLGTVTGLANLLPMPPLDGYRVIAHAAGVAELAGGSREFAALAGRRLIGRGDGIGAYPPRLRLLYGGFALVLAVQSLALLALCGLVLRSLLPGQQAFLAWALTPALLLAAVLLRTLGTRARNRRAATTPTEAAGPPTPPGTPPSPAPHPHPARKDTMTGPDSETKPPAATAATEPRAHPDPAPGPQTEPVITVEAVGKRYGEVNALDGVSLTVRRGEFLGILGPNGAGKTTLVEILGGLRQADTGRVALFGRAPWPRDPALLSRIGVQTQASAFFARLTAGEHLRTVAALYGIGTTAADTALERVGLTGKAGARVDDLSGGQRQRLAIATALINEPELIFFDEPTAALDPEARRELWGLLRSLHSEGRTIVYTTHHLEEAEALCDRVAIIAGGRVAALDSPRNLVRALAAPARLLLPVGELTVKDALALEGVDRAAEEGADLVIESTVPNRVLTLLGELMDIEAVTVRTATLEDAYLTLTGHRTEHDR